MSSISLTEYLKISVMMLFVVDMLGIGRVTTSCKLSISVRSKWRSKDHA